MNQAMAATPAVNMEKDGAGAMKNSSGAPNATESTSLLPLLLSTLESTLSPQRFAALRELTSLEKMNVPLINPISLYDELRPQVEGQDVLTMLLQYLLNIVEEGGDDSHEVNSKWCHHIYNSFTRDSFLIRSLSSLGTGGRVSIGGPLSELAVARILAQMSVKRAPYLGLAPVSLQQRIREKKATISLRRAVKKELNNEGNIPRWLVSGEEVNEWSNEAMADYYTFYLRQYLYGILLPEPWMDGGVLRSSLSDAAWELRGESVSVLSQRTHLLNRSYRWEESSPIPAALLSHRGRLTGAEAIATAVLVKEYNDEWVAALISQG